MRPPNTLSPLMLRAVGLAVVALLLVSCSETGGVERPSASSTRTPSSLPSLTASLPNPTRSPERSESEPATETAPEPGATRSPQRGESTSPTETAPEPTRSSETAAPPPPTQPAPETTRSSQVVAAPSPTQPETEPTRTESSAPEEPTSPTETESTAAPSPTTSPSVQPTSTESNGPTWLRWLLVALVVALAVAIPLLVRASHRREWRDALASAEDEVAWFARGLIPQLRQMGSLAEVAGGWNLAEGRVAALEDKLTALEPTAPDDVARARALDLRDAVRAARGQIRALLQAGRQETRTQDLDAVAARLEQVLGAGTPLD